MMHFWERVDCSAGPEGCWPWLGARKDAYGSVGRSERAHRMAFRLAGGVILDGQLVRHLCNNPLCCNPAHLAAGTHSENMHDMAEAKRGRQRVLSADQRRQAVMWYGRGLATSVEIARLLHVTPQRVRHMYQEAG